MSEKWPARVKEIIAEYRGRCNVVGEYLALKELAIAFAKAEEADKPLEAKAEAGEPCSEPKGSSPGGPDHPFPGNGPQQDGRPFEARDFREELEKWKQHRWFWEVISDLMASRPAPADGALRNAIEEYARECDSFPRGETAHEKGYSDALVDVARNLRQRALTTPTAPKGEKE
jgi:hypothetical protein